MTRVSIISPHTTHIGESEAMPRLAGILAENGFLVDLVNVSGEWDGLQLSQPGARVVTLGSSRVGARLRQIAFVSSWLAYRLWAFGTAAAMIPTLARYLQVEKPDVVVARMLTAPVSLAHLTARSKAKLIMSMAGVPRTSTIRRIMWPLLYPRSHSFVSPNHEVIQHAVKLAKVSPSRFTVLPNPVIEPVIHELARAPVSHDWLVKKDLPVILGVGRLTRQKGFSTLLKAFALLPTKVKARLIILGEGEDRPMLEGLAKKLNTSHAVSMPGHVANPYSYISKADVYVMSSRWEGPGHALIEAQALGIPSISTTCPAGPRETLLNGEAGLLVPVDDPPAMATAIERFLNDSATAHEMATKGQQAAKAWGVLEASHKWSVFLQQFAGENNQ